MLASLSSPYAGPVTDPLARRRTLPSSGALQMLEMADGWRLRTGHWSPPSPRGSILLITGRGDFIEKYAETIHDWLDAGWAVSSFDWRGQGGSGRLGQTPQHGHLTDFAPLRQDLAAIIARFHATSPAPHHAVAHSMGGHLLLHHLADHPGSISRAVLLAPMLGIAAGPLPPWLSRSAARLIVSLGRAHQWVPGAGPFGTSADARAALLTSDPARFADERWWATQHPELAIGGVTWGWLDAAFRSLAALHTSLHAAPARPQPLVLLAEHEQLVDNAATRTLFPQAQIMPGAAHELLREATPIRTRVLAAIARHLA